MKHIKTFEGFLNEQEEMLNEDAASMATSIVMLMQATATLALVMAKSGSFGSGGDEGGIKDWWNNWRRDRQVNKILDKLKDDPEILQFLELPTAQQRGKWQKLIATKLTDDEQKYLMSISRDRVKKGKI
jgi:hypothetical protein